MILDAIGLLLELLLCDPRSGSDRVDWRIRTIQTIRWIGIALLIALISMAVLSGRYE